LLCRRTDGSLCLFEPSVEQLTSLPLSLKVHHLPHSRNGRTIASTCKQYMAHSQHIEPLKRRQRATLRLTIFRFNAPISPLPSTSTSSSTASRSRARSPSTRVGPKAVEKFVIDAIPISPNDGVLIPRYDLRVWFSYDSTILYYSFISDGPRSTSWVPPPTTETKAQATKRQERLQQQIDRGLWCRRVVSVRLANFETMDVKTIPLNDEEKAILCGLPVPIPGQQYGTTSGSIATTSSTLASVDQTSFSSALHEHIYRSLHMALGRAGQPRVVDALQITCSSPDQRRHLVGDRDQQITNEQRAAKTPAKTTTRSRVWMVDVTDNVAYPVIIPDDVDSDRLQWHRWYTPGIDESGAN
jgi:hypothetical protein